MIEEAQLREWAVESFNEHTLAGLALGVARDGRLERFVGLGLANAGAGARPRRAVDRDTVFRVGSISKTMTAIAVMQLVEEGRLALDDPVAEHVSSIRIDQRARRRGDHDPPPAHAHRRHRRAAALDGR